MSESLNTRTARWLLAMIVLLILYGSLYPFELRPVSFRSIADLPGRLQWGRTTRGDIFANVLLYLPFGTALAWSLPASLASATRLAAVIACGALLSFAVETAQLFTAMRVAALSDVACNTAGSALGALAAIAIGALARRLHASEVFKLTREPVSAAVAVLWLASFLPPWLPWFYKEMWSEDWARLLHGGASLSLSALHALGWLIVALAVRTLTRPQYTWPILLILVAATLLVRFTVCIRFAAAGEAIGAAVALAAWPLAARVRENRLALVLFTATLAVLAWRGLVPFEFTRHAHALNVVPFADLITRGSTGFNLPILFGKGFWCGALVWLLVRRGTPALGAGVFVAACLATLEFLQLWTAGGDHAASTTDPVIALAAAVAIALLGSLAGSGAAETSAATKRKARRAA